MGLRGMNTSFFCGKCGRMLTAYDGRLEQDVVCACGHTQKMIHELTAGEKLSHAEKIGGGVVRPDTKGGFPNVCKKCGHEGADVTDLGSPYSDESPIYLYRCKKCGFVERHSEGTGNS